MRKIVLVAMTFCASVFSQQSSSRTVLDSYYKDYLIFEDSQQVVSSKINYPGLLNDSLSTIDIGFLAGPDYYSADRELTVNNSENLQLDDLSGWGEKRGRFGKIGVWIGSLDFSHSESESYSSPIEKRFATGSSAFWFVPYHKSVLKGVSLSFGGEYNNSKQNNSNSYNVNSSYKYKTLDIGFNALFQCNERYQVAMHLVNSKSTNVLDYESFTNSYYSDYNSYYTSSINNKSSSKYQNYGLGITLLDSKRKQLTAYVNASLDNNTLTRGNYSYSGYYGSNSNFGIGHVVASLVYSDTKVLKYLKHRAYVGINAVVTFDFPAVSESGLSFVNLLKNATKDKYSAEGNVQVPVTIDVNVFNTPLYLVAKITPAIKANTYHNNIGSSVGEVHILNGNSLGASVYETAIGFKGKIGDQLECALIPSIRSNVFVAGLELKYNFGGKSEKPNSL